MWNIYVILFVIQYIYSHFDALLNISQFTILNAWQNINFCTTVKPLYRFKSAIADLFLIPSFKMIDNAFISIHVKCSNCICIGSLPTTFENSYLNLLSTHIVLEPIFISETSFTITFCYNLYTELVQRPLLCMIQKLFETTFLVLLNVKMNKTINMKYTSNYRRCT